MCHSDTIVNKYAPGTQKPIHLPAIFGLRLPQIKKAMNL